MKVSSSAPPEDLTIRQGRLFPGLGARDCEGSDVRPLSALGYRTPKEAAPNVCSR